MPEQEPRSNANLLDDIKTSVGIDVSDEDVDVAGGASEDEYWETFGLTSTDARQPIQWGKRGTTVGDLATKFYAYQPQEMEMLQRILALKGLYSFDEDEIGIHSEKAYKGYLTAISRELRKQKARTPPTLATPSVSESLMPITPTEPPETGVPRVRRKGVAPIG